MPAHVPEGYGIERERGAEVVALPSVIGTLRAAVAEHGTLADWARAQPGARVFTGRGAAWGVTTAHGPWVVRHYRRGGWVARVLNDRYLRTGETRPLLELHASVRARARGVATPEVVAAVVYPHGAFYRADLATRLIPDSRDLAEAVLGPGRLDEPGRLAAWRAAGELLAAAFRAGVHHRDLNLRNILIQTRPEMNAFLLDLDRATVGERPVSDDVRAAMVARLHRSRAKLQSVWQTAASRDELRVFEEGLQHG